VSSPNTPGPAGYAFAVLISVLVLPVELAVVYLASAGPARLAPFPELVDDWVAIVAFAAVPASVIGPIGALGVHVLCRDVPAQRVHVLAAFCAGVVLPAVALPFVGPPVFLLVGVAAAAGRASVIQLVPRRRTNQGLQ